MLANAEQHVPKSTLSARRIQDLLACHGQKVAASHTKPQGSIRCVTVGVVICNEHVGKRPVALHGRELQKNLTRLPMVSCGNQATQGDQRIAPPVQEPRVAGKDGLAAPATHNIGRQRALHSLVDRLGCGFRDG